MTIPQREYKQNKNTKYHTIDELLDAWVKGTITLTSILKMFRHLSYGIDRRTRKELYRGAIHKIYRIRNDILFGTAQHRKWIREKYGQDLVDRETEVHKKARKLKERPEE